MSKKRKKSAREPRTLAGEPKKIARDPALVQQNPRAPDGGALDASATPAPGVGAPATAPAPVATTEVASDEGGGGDGLAPIALGLACLALLLSIVSLVLVWRVRRAQASRVEPSQPLVPRVERPSEPAPTGVPVVEKRPIAPPIVPPRPTSPAVDLVESVDTSQSEIIDLRLLLRGDADAEQSVSAILGRLRYNRELIAEHLLSDTRQAYCVRQLGEILAARLQRHYEDATAKGVASWDEADLFPTLDAIARIHSDACWERRSGHASAGELADILRETLYGALSAACRAECNVELIEVQPCKTPFDPRLHHAVDGRPDPELADIVLEVHGCARRAIRTGQTTRAQVVVGR